MLLMMENSHIYFILFPFTWFFMAYIQRLTFTEINITQITITFLSQVSDQAISKWKYFLKYTFKKKV